ncbi:MAG: hypothetical protein BroJett015_11240 [Chloroflexota bacterium]|nr:MAG: hypothetical protein BroJett015_11240 [Chloroflexota bacterium]
MQILKRFLVCSIVAIITCGIAITGVQAGAYGYISEYSSNFTASGSITAVSPCNSTCKYGNAKQATQNNGATGFWNTGQDGVVTWDVWIPDPVPGATYAAVRYYVYSDLDDFNVPVNQNNWKNSYVYLGNLNWYGTWGQVVLPSSCLPGYTCSGLKVYYDLVRYWYN